ncbi:MAG TPA: DUF433 domain-containing protein [Candidatus Binatia bacterium]|nr:DUF433 domain-containing protein [Candidatus Binatia bacterium]
MNPLLERISIDPNVCFGKPCIKGTRIWVSLLLDFLANGDTEVELLNAYPQLTHDDILAAIAYGAKAARERIIPVPTEPLESWDHSPHPGPLLEGEGTLPGNSSS